MLSDRTVNDSIPKPQTDAVPQPDDGNEVVDLSPSGYPIVESGAESIWVKSAQKVNAEDIEEETPIELSPTDTIGEVPRFPNPFWHPIRAIGWIIRTVWGLASLTFMLAVIAAIPGVNFLALGYLLEVEGRVARTGKFRFAFPLLDIAPRIGSIALGVWLWLIPVRLFSHFAADASLINPSGQSAIILQQLNVILAILVSVHLVLALARGGSLNCFFRPLRNGVWFVRQIRSGDYFLQAESAIRSFITSMRLRHHFSLGLRGFIGAFLWLVIPTFLYAGLSSTNNPGQVLMTIIGGFLLHYVFCWIPFLQAHFASKGNLRSLARLGEVRELWRRSPFIWTITTIIVFALSLPLYLFKVALPPEDAMWGVTIVFIVSIYPARVLTGWAYHRAARKTKRAHILWRMICWTIRFPALAFYVFILFFSQDISAAGKFVLYQHHAFLLPIPEFVGF